jgi:hypothetical protein
LRQQADDGGAPLFGLSGTTDRFFQIWKSLPRVPEGVFPGIWEEIRCF